MSSQSTAAAVEIHDLHFGWQPHKPVLAIRELTIPRGERVFLQGPSGSGKSTLLAIVGGVLSSPHGTVDVLDAPLHAMRPAKRDALRADRIGFIFQMFNLLPYLSILDNVTLPCRFSARRRAAAIATGNNVVREAQRLLGRLGLEDDEVLRRPVVELSIGQQQRVAAARALIGRPDLVIADEPTSALDTDTRQRFIDLLLQECATVGATVVFVSHDGALGNRFDRRIALGEVNAA